MKYSECHNSIWWLELILRVPPPVTWLKFVCLTTGSHWKTNCSTPQSHDHNLWAFLLASPESHWGNQQWSLQVASASFPHLHILPNHSALALASAPSPSLARLTPPLMRPPCFPCILPEARCASLASLGFFPLYEIKVEGFFNTIKFYNLNSTTNYGL